MLSVGLWLLVCEESTTQGRGSDSHHEIWEKRAGREVGEKKPESYKSFQGHTLSDLMSPSPSS